VPKARIDAGVDAAIGQQFDGVIGEVDIQQHARVILGIPHF
jgi:hypothetical protein